MLDVVKRRASIAALTVSIATGCAGLPEPRSDSDGSANAGAAQAVAASGPAGQRPVKRKKTPEQRQARFEAIGERYRLTHASEDGTIRVDGLIVAARQRAELEEFTKQLGMAKAAGITRASWTELGPDKIGGRGRALIIDPDNANQMWFGAATGGIWASVDGGASWSATNDYLPNLAISHMDMDMTNRNVMYAASGEPFASGVSGNAAFRGVGLFKSTDRGVTWNLLEATRPTSAASPWIAVHRVAVNPGNGNHVWAATRGGLWRSIDGGTTWQRKALPGEDADCGGACSVTELAFHPANAQQFVVASGALMYSSTDGGETFKASRLTDPNSARNPAANVRTSIAAARNTPGRFVASVNHAEPDSGTPASTDRGQVWVSTDSGATWTWLATPRHLGGQGDYDNAIWVDPADEKVIVAAGIDVWRTLDGGATPFVKVSDWRGPRELQAHADHHVIVHDPGYNGTTNRRVYITNDGGVYRADDIRAVNAAPDATSGWTRLNTKLRVTQFYTITSRLVDGRLQVLGGTQDNGNPLLRPTGTADWVDITGGDGAGVGIDSRNPKRMYTAYIYSTPQSGVDGESGQATICTPAQIPGGCADNTGEVPGGAKSNFIAPMILDPNNSDRLLTGTNDLMLSKNPTAAAPAWESIKSGFPLDDGNYVASIEVARGNSDVIMVGHNGGQIFRTTKGTQADVATSWTQVGAGTLPSRYNTSISIDPRNAARAWVTYGGFDSGNVWFTADGGQNWTNIHNNLPVQPVYRVLPHPSRDDWLYAATETGVYTSENGGTTWTTPDDGPAYVIVHDMTFVGDTLVIGTHGRGAWRVDTVPASTFALTVAKAGAGGGMVTSSPAGINCGATCSASFDANAVVTLTASAASGSSFAGWSGGGCTGTSTCQVTMSQAQAVTATFALAASASRLANISTRGPVLIGNEVMIGGFVIGGSTPKKVLITSRGPSLAGFGITNPLGNPKIELYSGQNKLMENDNWESDANAAQVGALGTFPNGLAPSSPLEAALMVTLNPGAYTAVVSGADGGTGVGIVEVFEQGSPEAPLVNISTRGQVQTGINVMIGGFIIQGSSPQTVLITARGPSLSAFGIANPLANPKLEIFSGQNKVHENDNWETDANAAQVRALGIFPNGLAPSNALEAAILVTLQPGAYTAVVSGADGGTGVGIVEVFAR
jgi:photosystem II stability/assembly factor-like uncharacterized protein